MRDDIWQLPDVEPACKTHSIWLARMLARNAGCAYLERHGSPRTEEEFRAQVPVIRYEQIEPFLKLVEDDQPNVLFDGSPVAFERTGGSCGGRKLVPYSDAGLDDFRYNLIPWLSHIVRRHRLSGSAYFAISPVARKPEFFGRYPVGLPDGAYLGEEAGALLQQRTAVPFEVGGVEDIDQWRRLTLEHLKKAGNLELVSVWSPTFLLRLCDGIDDTRRYWPRLKVISCWASGPAKHYIDALSRLFPQATIEPKGLLSTEAVVTVPDEQGLPRLVPHGYFEFLQKKFCFRATELTAGEEYEVILTTASGLYRYATGDRVLCLETDAAGRPVLEFIGRDSLSCDLVGEKLTESFVGQCIGEIDGFATLVPDVRNPGYVLICERAFSPQWLAAFESRLGHNPQYEYARRLEQLKPLRQLVRQRPFDAVERIMQHRGVRLGDIKPTALRTEDFWLPIFEELRR